MEHNLSNNSNIFETFDKTKTRGNVSYKLNNNKAKKKKKLRQKEHSIVVNEGILNLNDSEFYTKEDKFLLNAKLFGKNVNFELDAGRPSLLFH
jgi:hypothetical protein